MLVIFYFLVFIKLTCQKEEENSKHEKDIKVDMELEQLYSTMQLVSAKMSDFVRFLYFLIETTILSPSIPFKSILPLPVTSMCPWLKPTSF